jgi:tetratricopeptide (TPR) repeat protein
LRDVIKKGNRVLEDMLVRRERKYTLFFRLVQPHDREQIDRMRSWNAKVEKAVGQVIGSRDANGDSDNSSVTSGTSSSVTSTASSATGSVSTRAGVFSRGRQLLPTAGRVRSRRATPTPRLRKHRKGDEGSGEAADDGFAASVSDPTRLKKHASGGPDDDDDGEMLPGGLSLHETASQLDPLKPLEPRDELVDVIRGLRVEKMKNRDSTVDNDLAALKPSWRPKADIPSSVPKLPIEYVHRHRLMKQVVGSLLDENESLPQSVDDSNFNSTSNPIITVVTSRHADKAGNGKSTLAVAVIQTVEIRERFSDGIAWLKLGQAALTERDIRRLYEDLYRQLVVKEADIDASVSQDQSEPDNFQESFSSMISMGERSTDEIERLVDRADSVRRFQGGDLEGIKEDLGRMIVKRKILICLDDVYRVEDAKWFVFETPAFAPKPEKSPYKILMTTLHPSLLGSGQCHEIFVRILSEHEAVKLFLSTAGRRPYGGRNSAVFNQSRLIVKGCGNSPLGILLVGSMLRQNNRNWNLNTPVWNGIHNQCRLNLEEAAQLRSFKYAFIRIVDASFFTIANPYHRIALRRCFVCFSVAFGSNDWVQSGRGIPETVLVKFFAAVIREGPMGDKNSRLAPEMALSVLENLKLMQRTMHSVIPRTSRSSADSVSGSSHGGDNDNDQDKSEASDEWDDLDDLPKRRIQHFFTMYDSLKTVAETLAKRSQPAFTPVNDNFIYFDDLIDEETRIVNEQKDVWNRPPAFVFGQIIPQSKPNLGATVVVEKVHETLISSLVTGSGSGSMFTKKSITEVMKANQLGVASSRGGRDKFEEYVLTLLPEHLMTAKAYSSAAALLTDTDFVRKRVFALGIMEATGRHVADIIDLRNLTMKALQRRNPNASISTEIAEAEQVSNITDEIMPAVTFDIDNVALEACKCMVDEVYKATSNMGSSDSLGMATCLATVGETLLKCRHPRDAMLRLEEAVTIYRALLGPYHVFTAHALHSVAKSLGKLGETRVALLKFAEAARIYEQCNATLHYDSIANAQSLASLLVDIGDLRKAESLFEEVIAMKKAVYGEKSIPVAKTINSYAILLAKHGRMSDALRNYDMAMATYTSAPPGIVSDPESDAKTGYDVTLIRLNIASIYSKKGDIKKALQSYAQGVQGLNEYDDAMLRIQQASGIFDDHYKISSHKHLVAALGRIGSLKLKLGDNDGALEAYLQLFDAVDDDSPIASHTEKAKAHIKVATIYRQRDEREKSIEHLKEALRMYKALYGPNHKDTVAIQTSLKQWLTEDKHRE